MRDLDELRALEQYVDDAAFHDRWRALLPSAEHHVVDGGHQVQLRTRFETLAAWLGRLPR